MFLSLRHSWHIGKLLVPDDFQEKCWVKKTVVDFIEVITPYIDRKRVIITDFH